MSAISMERCPPSQRNGVRHHGGMPSAITAQRCPGSRGIRRMSALRWLAEKIDKQNIVARENAAYGIEIGRASCRERVYSSG